MSSSKDFNGPEYHSMCQQEYDAARHYLKNCGKPKDEVDRFFIEFNRENCRIFGGALDRKKTIEAIRIKEAIEKELFELSNRCLVLSRALEKLNESAL